MKQFAHVASFIALGLAGPAFAADSQIELRWSERLNDGAVHRTITQQISNDTTSAVAAAQPKYVSAPDQYNEAPIALHSQSVLVYDQESGAPLLAKNAQMQTPIASITKLMTAMLILDAGQSMDDPIIITPGDRDTLKGTSSRLAIGSVYTRGQLLHLALIASDNRAAHALGRRYPGGMDRFVEMMNRKAKQLGMTNTVYVEPTGLNQANRSTANDLARLVNHAYQNYPQIREISSSGNYTLGTQRVVLKKRNKKSKVLYRTVAFNNTNRLTRQNDWHIGLSKTGFINEAGHCLVMQARVAHKNVIIVLLDAVGTYNRVRDASRIKRWLETMPAGRLGQSGSDGAKS